MSVSDFFSSVAQVAVAIAGFSGIVVAVGQRTIGDLSALERVRLVGLLTDAFLALMLSLMTMILLNTDIASSRVWLVCSAVEAIAISVAFGVRFRHAFRTVSAEFARSRRGLAIFLPILVVVFLLQVYNVMSLCEFWPFAVGLVFHVWASLVLFGGLLFEARGRDA